jgi:starch phosphorylase
VNDTHPTIAVVELMRILIDEEDVPFDEAWAITTKVFAYTNHTVLPEALERWPVPLFGHLLPRHLQIIYTINHNFLSEVAKTYPGDIDRIRRMSIIDETGPKYVRMAFLAVVGSFKVNGVAEWDQSEHADRRLHSQLLQATILRDFVEFYGRDKFVNVTNGITFRRWLLQCNPQLAALMTRTLGSDRWLVDHKLLASLLPKADDKAFCKSFYDIKVQNKARVGGSI